MDDIKIIDLFFKRDENALVETKNKYGHYCMSIAYNILNDYEDSEECVSDTYLGAWNSIPPTRPDSLSAYLAKITRNLALKRYRSKTAKKRGGTQADLAFEELENLIADAGNPEEAFEEAELTRLLDEFLSELKPSHRRIFICRYWYLDSVSDIARQNGCTQSKVKMVLKRSRDKFIQKLQAEGGSYEV